MSRSQLNSLQSLFEKYQDGAADTLVEIIEIERPQLFDFMIRMTASKDRAMKVLDEVTKALMAQTKWVDELQQLRVMIYATARSFSADSWNKDASVLLEKAGETSLKEAEKSLLSLPGWEREPLILKCRCRFNINEIAQIMSSDARVVESSYRAGVTKMSNDLRVSPGEVERILNDALTASGIEKSGASTMALSQLMGDIEHSRDALKNRNRLLLTVLLLAAVAVYFYLRFHKTISL